MSERILSVLVEDKPGVLARVASTISRRGFNINSLSVGPTHIEGRSKMTIVTELDAVKKIKKQFLITLGVHTFLLLLKFGKIINFLEQAINHLGTSALNMTI